MAARVPLDKAKPMALTVTDTNGATDGKIEPGDTITVTFTEALDPASVPASSTVTVTDPVGAGNDTLTLTGVSNGARTTGSNNYLTLDGGVAAFASSPVALGAGNKTITVTVGPTCTGTGCASLVAIATVANYSFVAATTLLDVGANIPLTTARTASLRLF
jgi:hypothetical protein